MFWGFQRTVACRTVNLRSHHPAATAPLAQAPPRAQQGHARPRVHDSHSSGRPQSMLNSWGQTDRDSTRESYVSSLVFLMFCSICLFSSFSILKDLSFIYLAFHRVICLGCELKKTQCVLRRMTPSMSGQWTLSSPVCSQREGAQQTTLHREQCHRTVNVMYRHRHTVHLTMFFVLKKIFSTSYLTVIFFLLKKAS